MDPQQDSIDLTIIILFFFLKVDFLILNFVIEFHYHVGRTMFTSLFPAKFQISFPKKKGIRDENHHHLYGPDFFCSKHPTPMGSLGILRDPWG